MTTPLKEHHVAIFEGREFRAAMTVDPDMVDLYWYGEHPPIAGFEELAPGILIRHTPLSEVDSVFRVGWECEYRGEPFKVTAERGQNLLLYYQGHDIDKARELGLDIEEKFVAVGLIPRDQVENLHEVRVQRWP